MLWSDRHEHLGHAEVRKPNLLGRRVSPDIDFTLIQSWIAGCQSEHKEACQPSNPDHDPRFKLIDVMLGNVINAPASCEYAALSYVWGNPELQLTLTKATKDSLIKPGALDEDCTRIPWTIRDAITVCRTLQIQYLWVDAFCIQQDDSYDLGQVDRMDKIFEGACITIVAASGLNSWAGLPGVRKNTRSASQQACSIDGETFLSCSVPIDNLMAHVGWNRRAWTLQELIFSKRLLIFAQENMYWACNREQWCEDTHLEDDELFELLSTSNLNGAVFLKSAINRMTYSGRMNEFFPQYISLVQRYTQRKLTHGEDTLRAFSGIMHSITDIFDGFLFGLPRTFFTASLLFDWAILRASTRQPVFPSWTWAGWRQHNPEEVIHFLITKDNLDCLEAVNVWFTIELGDSSISELHLTKLEDSYIRKNDQSMDELMNKCKSCIFEAMEYSEKSWVAPFRWHGAIVFEASCIRVQLTTIDSELKPGISTLKVSRMSYTASMPNVTTVDFGAIQMESSWYSSLTNSLELITVAKLETYAPERASHFFVMLICDTGNNIWSKVSCPQWTVSEETWARGRPRRRIVLLA